MYDKSDPRARLAPAPKSAPVPTSYTPADYLRFYEMAPQLGDELSRTWLGRGSNAVIAYSEAKAKAVLARQEQVDEWVLLLPDADTVVEIAVGGATHRIAGYSLTFVPPGESSLSVIVGGRVVRMFTSNASDLMAVAANAATYAAPNQLVPPFVAWPVPPEGYKVRSYSLDVKPQPGRFGRIWRCTTFMVNAFDTTHGPRDVTKLSPHHHDDFEQFSLALQGSFIHHMRWAWTPNMKMWRNDEHEFCGTPSLTIIPPPATHTTRSLDPGPNLLIDIFSPPRIDFSRLEGWVLNALDYPIA